MPDGRPAPAFAPPGGEGPATWQLPEAAGYALAVGGVALGWLLRLAVTAWSGEALPTYATFFPAVMLAALLGGRGPGILATALTGVSVAHWSLPPEGLAVGNHQDMVGLAWFLLMGLLVTAVADLTLRARLRAAARQRDASVRAIRAQTEEALRTERALLASVTATTDVMLVYLDTDFNFVWVNQAYADTCRMTPQAMVGRNHFALYPHAENEAIFRQVRDTGEPAVVRDRPFEFPDQPERGITYWDWSLSATRDRGLVDGLVLSLRETTAQVRARQALQEGEERFRRLFANMAEAFALHEIVTDDRGQPVDIRFLDVNPAFERLTGLHRSALAGRLQSEVLPDAEPYWLEAFGRVALTGEPARFENHSAPLGRWYAGHAYRTVPGQFAVMFTDVTERRAEAEALTHAKEAAEAASRAKSAFLANMSHEIRTPLNAIVGLGHLLRRDLTDSGHGLRLDQLCASADHLLAVINDILDISKIEAERLVLDHSDFRLSSVLDRVVRLLEPAAHEKGLELRLEIDDRLRGATLCGDALRLSQVLINLAGNAVKFTERGSVCLAVTNAGAPDDDPLPLAFTVSDTGIGIPADDLERVFEPFEQVEDAAGPRRQGTGLGLAISRRLVTLMGGAIRVRSRPGAGSAFTFDVALPRGAGTVAEDRPAPGGVHAAGKHVLAVEDHPLAQDIVFEMLDRLGCTVDVAGDGIEAIECARDHAYDLILMDIQMPRMDGLTATRAIRGLPAHRQTPIVALTANSFAEDRRRCLEAGMNGHIAKPLTPAALEDALGIWLPPPQAGAAKADPDDADLGRALDAIPGLDSGSAFRREIARQSRYAELLRQYVATHEHDMGRLRELLAGNDREAARQLVHSLKGVSAMIGARQVATLAAELHGVLRAEAGDLAGALTACDTALAELAAAVRALPGTVGQ